MFLMNSLCIVKLSGKFSGLMYQNSEGFRNNLSEPPPNTKLFKVLYLFWIGFDFGTHHSQEKEVPGPNKITFHNFVLNMVLICSEGK